MPRARARNGRFTAERTTETTTTVTERITVEEADTLTALPPIDWADGTVPGEIPWVGGWDSHAITTEERRLMRAQRDTQQARARELLADWTVSVPAGTPIPQWLTDATSNMLRAGPRATPLQLKWGRDI